MNKPLVSRPPYGNPQATAQLPQGDPAGKGLPLGDDVAGYETFVKPLDDNGTSDTPSEGSIYRTDTPRDWAKPQEGDDSIDHSRATPSYMGLGERDPNDYSITRYPHRDDKSTTHNASEDPEFVAQLYLLRKKAGVLFRYEERTASRVAATAEQILSGLNPEFADKAKRAVVTLKRVDAKNLRWIFSVKGNGTYAVKMKAIRPRKNRTRLSKMDLELSCSCPAWRWLGPEYHAKQDEYQLGKAQGTASTPNIRDPERINRVCKHVAAVLNATRNWDIPVK